MKLVWTGLYWISLLVLIKCKDQMRKKCFRVWANVFIRLQQDCVFIGDDASYIEGHVIVWIFSDTLIIKSTVLRFTFTFKCQYNQTRARDGLFRIYIVHLKLNVYFCFWKCEIAQYVICILLYWWHIDTLFKMFILLPLKGTDCKGLY